MACTVPRVYELKFIQEVDEFAAHGVAFDEVLKSSGGGTNGFCADQVSMWVLQAFMKRVTNGLQRTFMNHKDIVIGASESCVD